MRKSKTNKGGATNIHGTWKSPEGKTYVVQQTDKGGYFVKRKSGKSDKTFLKRDVDGVFVTYKDPSIHK